MGIDAVMFYAKLKDRHFRITLHLLSDECVTYVLDHVHNACFQKRSSLTEFLIQNQTDTHTSEEIKASISLLRTVC